MKINWKKLHSLWTLVLQLDVFRYSYHYPENTSKEVNTCIAAWIECVTVKIIWKLIHIRWTLIATWTKCVIVFIKLKIFYSRWRVVLLHEWSVLQLKLYGRYLTAGANAAWMECVTVNITWKILHSRWTVVLQLELSVLQCTLYGRYFTAARQWYWSLN